MSALGAPQRAISAISYLLFVFWCWSQMICGFCFTVELIQIRKNKTAGSEKYLWLSCQAIKLKSTAKSRKTQSLFNKKGHEEKGNLFPEVVLRCCGMFYPLCNELCTFTSSLSSLFCAQDALLALLTQHESVRVTQRSSGVPICYWRDLSPDATTAVASSCIPASQAFAAPFKTWFMSCKSVEVSRIWQIVISSWKSFLYCCHLSEALLCICTALYVFAKGGQQPSKKMANK